MPATPNNTIADWAAGYYSLAPTSPAQAYRIALLARTLGVQTGDFVMTAQQLAEQSACYTCLGMGTADAAEILLLDLVYQSAGGGGGGGSGQLKTYVTDPNAELVVPDDLNLPAQAYSVDNTGPTYAWSVANQNWMT